MCFREFLVCGQQEVELGLHVLLGRADAGVRQNLKAPSFIIVAVAHSELVGAGNNFWSSQVACPHDEAIKALGIGIAHIPHELVEARFYALNFVAVFFGIGGEGPDALALCGEKFQAQCGELFGGFTLSSFTIVRFRIGLRFG